MFNKRWQPDDFNFGKIYPIVKDNKQSLKDVINLRPITVSDTLSNIFEKYLLLIINKKITDKKEQLGFTKNSSTQHFCSKREYQYQTKQS